MAVDTAQKRRSMVSFGRMNYAERVPSATDYDAPEDRAQMVYLYAGLDITGSGPTPSPAVAAAHFQLLKRKRLGLKGR